MAPKMKEEVISKQKSKEAKKTLSKSQSTEEKTPAVAVCTVTSESTLKEEGNVANLLVNCSQECLRSAAVCGPGHPVMGKKWRG